MSIEKRQYIRHPSDIPILYKLIDKSVFREQPLRNISLGGLCFHTNQHLEPETLILVQIDLVRPIFQEKARIVWCQKRPRETSYDVGVRFLNQSTGSRARIVEQVCYIEQYKRDLLEHEGRELSGEEAAIEWIEKYADDFPVGK
jgi:c-di-GMP-binding flagellar brake protein YcgR